MPGPNLARLIADDAHFQWVNKEASRVYQTALGAHMIAPVGTAQNHMRTRPAPRPPYQLTVGLLPTLLGDLNGVGIGVGDNSSGLLVMFVAYQDLTTVANVGQVHLATFKYTTHSVFSAAYTDKTVGALPFGSILWLRIIDDGGDLRFHVSHDGERFVEFDKRARTNFLANPNTLNVHVVSSGASIFRSAVSVVSWVEEEYIPQEEYTWL